MHADGYNVVRVFLNNCCASGSLGNPAGGVSPEYVHNLADFLKKAKANGIYVIFCIDGLPAVGGYIEILESTKSESFAGENTFYLREGGVRAEAKLWRDLIQGLIDQGAPLDAIFAYQLRNEMFFEAHLPPFSLSSGKVATANGKSYDMASSEAKQQMMDEGLVYWIDTVRSEILKLDPTALVTVGFFVPQEPNPARIGDTRVIETRPAIWESTADFIDLHAYPGLGLNLAQYVKNFGMAGMHLKPILMGEFGAARASYATEASTARALHDWQVESCQYGFDGWLLWTWDSEEQIEFYNGLTGKGLINHVLMPYNRPDPCAAGLFDFFEYNLALGKKTSASRALPEQPASSVVDGNANSKWVAGDFAPQWVQIDLGKISTIGMIRLVITQSPEGDTLHQVWVGSAADQLSLVHTFEGFTSDSQVLEFRPDNPIENVRFIRVETKLSPSWVGWKEIEVFSP
jgi:preprotein translocase subunit Sec61beta